MSERLNKTINFKEKKKSHQVEVLVRSPPAGAVAPTRGELHAPAMTAGCRNQSNEMEKLSYSSLWEVKPEQ